MRYSTVRCAAAWLLLWTAAMLAGCGSDGPTAPAPAEVTGTYTLQSVGGEELPLLFFEDADIVVELRSGSVTLLTDGTFQELLTFAETPTGAGAAEIVEIATTGTYTVEGNTVIFFAPEEGSWRGTFADRSITYVIWDVPFTFRM